MRRSDREQDRAFALDLIDRCSHGVAAISTGEDTPYCLPLSLARVDDSLYFHCAKAGRKVELLRNNPRVCVTFVGGDVPAYVESGSYYTTYFQSAIVTGTAVEVTQDGEKIAALRAICEKMTPGQVGTGFDHAIEKSLAVTAVWRIDMDQITAKAKFQK